MGEQRLRTSAHLAQEGLRPRPHGEGVDEGGPLGEGAQGAGGGAQADRYGASVLPYLFETLHDGGAGVCVCVCVCLSLA